MNRKTDVTEITCKRLKRAWVTELLKQYRLGIALKSLSAGFLSYFLVPSVLKLNPRTEVRHDASFCQLEEVFPLNFAAKPLRRV